MQPQIENAIMTAFADTMRVHAISLRQAEKSKNYIDLKKV